MICRHCHTEFDASAVLPGESIRCPGCGKLYLRKVAPEDADRRPVPKSSPKPVHRRRSGVLGGILAVVFTLLLLAGGLGLAGYYFAPDLFHKVTFGAFLREEAEAQEPYVPGAFISAIFDAQGKQQYTATFRMTYTKEGLLLSYRGENRDMVFQYEYDDRGYPKAITVRENQKAVMTAAIRTTREGDVLKVRFEGSETEQLIDFLVNCCARSYAPFWNADLSDGGYLVRIRDGENVFSEDVSETRRRTEEVQRSEDGRKTVRFKTVYDDASFISTREYDLQGRLIKIMEQNLEGNKGTVEIQYFRERSEDGTSVDRGVIVAVTGNRYDKAILGDVAAEYEYDEDGALTVATEYDLDVSPLQPLIKDHYRDGRAIQENIHIYTNGVLHMRNTTEYVPLSQVIGEGNDLLAGEAAAEGQSTIPEKAADAGEPDAPLLTSPTAQPAILPAQPEPIPTESWMEAVTPAPTIPPTPEPTLPPTPTPTVPPTAEPARTPEPEPRKATILHCNNAANVRAEPSSSSAKLGSLAWGKTVTVLSQEGDWTKIQYKGGEAYVFSKYVVIHHMGTIVDVKTRVTVRVAPDETSERLGAINKGKSVEVIEIDGDWAMIVYSGSDTGIAYVHSKFVQLDD